MDAVTMHHGIPFENELNLVRDYLYMEKKRFGEKLKIRYVITENDFLVPALSIQPIVENAVRHGIRQKLEGGTVSIETYRDGTDYMVRIKDDGVGFDPNAAKDDGRRHVGSENVRSRLALMCGGRLYINSIPGAGTEVILRIPDIQIEDAGE